jgi:cysteine desulfurase
MAALRDRLEEGLKELSPTVTIFGESSRRLPNTTLCAISGQRAETAIIALDLAGIAVSAGAACSSGKVQPSHVLAAMGVDPALAGGAIRLSLGYTTTESAILRFLDAWRKLLESLHKSPDGIVASSEIAEAGAQ